MESTLLLKNDDHGWNELRNSVLSHYKQCAVQISFFTPEDQHSDDLKIYFLIDRRYVVRYLIGLDRGMYLGTLQLAIGPHYFGPADFWSYEASQRFTLEASTEGVLKNLRLLDEFLGYSPKPLF
jgi:hypothetical protein